MNNASQSSVKIDYLGWSGFHIYDGNDPHIFVDPPKGTDFPKGRLNILITHGHPEHLGGVYDLIRTNLIDQSVSIIASETVCNFLRKSTSNRDVNFIGIQPFEKKELSENIQLLSFEWSHMPLLPPGIKAAGKHIWQIIKSGKQALNILKMSLKGPNGAGTMLGYVLKINGQNIIIYGEGLHRNCLVEEVNRIGTIAPSATILVAAEPEDIEELPILVHASGALNAILYEPHRPWRDQFQLPHIDLQYLMKKISSLGIETTIAE